MSLVREGKIGEKTLNFRALNFKASLSQRKKSSSATPPPHHSPQSSRAVPWEGDKASGICFLGPSTMVANVG